MLYHADSVKYYKREESATYGTVALVRDLLPLIRPYRTSFWFASLLRFIGQVIWLYPPYALASIVTFFARYQPGDDLTPLLWIGTLWALISTFHYIGLEVAAHYGYQTAERVALSSMQKTLEHLLLLDMRWHEKENSGNKLKRIQRGGEGIDKVIRIWFDNIIDCAVNFVGMIFILARFDLLIGLLTILFLVSYIAIAFYLTSKAGEAANVTTQMEEEVAGLEFEILNNIRSVKVLGMGNGLLALVSVKFGQWFLTIRRRIAWFRTRDAVVNMWGQIFRLGILFYIVYGIIHGWYEVGFLVLFYNYFNYIWESINQLSRVSLDFVIGKYGFWRMKQILDEPIGIDSEVGKREFPKNWKKLTVKNLSFSYGTKPVLKNISFTITRGERTGVVGLSGAGKSTLFKLLLKEYENYDGEILFDGVPLRDIKRTSMFQHTAVVLQDTEVFNFSLRDNIVLATQDASNEKKRLQESIAVAHVDDFLNKLPQGLDTLIGEKGIKLSGGEKQRLGIARAVYKQPQLLFLDEATSHLDLESEEKIRDSLHQFFQSVTAVVIAHRLTTIREMDRILVLENGQIIEEGNFDELYAKKGRFYELWEKQKF